MTNSYYAVCCPACRNKVPEVFDCLTCTGIGKIVVAHKRDRRPSPARLAAWLFFFAALGLAAWKIAGSPWPLFFAALGIAVWKIVGSR